MALHLDGSTAGVATLWKVLSSRKLVEVKLADFSDRTSAGISIMTSAADYMYTMYPFPEMSNQKVFPTFYQYWCDPYPVRRYHGLELLQFNIDRVASLVTGPKLRLEPATPLLHKEASKYFLICSSWVLPMDLGGSSCYRRISPIHSGNSQASKFQMNPPNQGSQRFRFNIE